VASADQQVSLEALLKTFEEWLTLHLTQGLMMRDREGFKRRHWLAAPLMHGTRERFDKDHS
jgi:hypothetical protein